MTNETIYRVTAKTTLSAQPSGTSWQRTVLYCGTDRTEARAAYHRSEPLDYGGHHGNPARRTLFEVIEDAGTDDAADDPVASVEAD